MSSYSDLINVSFQDATSHINASGADIMGVYMPYFWGPVDTLKVYNRSEFYDNYPESLPVGHTFNNSGQFYNAYAQIKKFFDNGGAYVEVFRPSSGMSYHGKTQGNYAVVTKYPGAVPASLLPSGTTALTLTVSETEVKLEATVNGSSQIVEKWSGQFTDETKTEDGQYTHFVSVLENSRILKCVSKDSVTLSESGTMFDFSESSFNLLNDGSAVETVSSEILNVFGDIEASSATILISPVIDDQYDTVYSGIVNDRMNCCFVSGRNLASTSAFSEETITAPNKFAVTVLGSEFVKLYSINRLQLNCVGGFVGATFKVAREEKLNQVASAKTYGAYSGTLNKTVNFSTVLSLHEKGFVVVYNSSTGPQIFGVHNNLYASKPTSYFSTWNVSRVLAAVLSEVFPLCFSAIHTDTAANPTTRASFEVRLNSIIGRYVAKQNLLDDSEAICSAEINTDVLTRGGRELNIILKLHFIGLVERVNIKVVATDSSVTAEII